MIIIIVIIIIIIIIINYNNREIPCQIIQYFWMLTPILLRFCPPLHHPQIMLKWPIPKNFNPQLSMVQKPLRPHCSESCRRYNLKSVFCVKMWWRCVSLACGQVNSLTKRFAGGSGGRLQLLYKQLALGWQTARQLSGFNPLSLTHNKKYWLKSFPFVKNIK